MGVGDRGKSRRRVWWTTLLLGDGVTARSLQDGITISASRDENYFPFFLRRSFRQGHPFKDYRCS